MKLTRGRVFVWLAGAAGAATIAWSFVPRPVSVETARVARGPIVVTVDEEGHTRVRDRFTISAPVAGYLERIACRAGTAVRAGDVVARVAGAPPTPLDARTRQQFEARVEAAVDGLRQARTRVDSARASLAQADRDLARQIQLEKDRVVAPQEVESASTRRQVAQADVTAAVAGAEVAEHALQEARAALAAATTARPSGRFVAVRAPRDGVILRVFEESERVVAAGTPLVEIGAPAALEIVVDVLSTDAVAIRPGARVLIERWGGAGALNGRVRLVEPSSFTKVSALGVEEQRVNVIIDFTDAPDKWQRLGDGFAVEARVVVTETTDALTVPTAALFRRGDEWAAFKVADGRAVEQLVRIGRQTSAAAELLGGLVEGDAVIVHPSEQIAPGVRVAVR